MNLPLKNNLVAKNGWKFEAKVMRLAIDLHKTPEDRHLVYTQRLIWSENNSQDGIRVYRY